MKKAVIVVFVLAAAAAAVFFATRLRHADAGIPLRMVYTSNTWGYLTPLEEHAGGPWMGGFGRRATVIKEAASPTTFVLDSGGFYADQKMGTEAYRHTVSKYILKGMERTGVEVANVGVIDQLIGRDALLELVDGLSFPFVSASLVDADSGEYVFEPFVVIEKAGVRVAFVGIIDPQFIVQRQVMGMQIDVMLPKNAERPDLSGLPYTGEGFNVLPLSQAFARVAPLLTGKADTAVVLADGGREIWRALKPYSDGKLFSMALCYSGKPNDRPQFQEKIPAFLNGVGGTTVGIVNSAYLGDGVVELKDWSAVGLYDTIESDKELAGLVREMRKSLGKIDPSLLYVKRYGPDREADAYVGPEACAHCHRQEYDIWKDSPHGLAMTTLKNEDAQYDPNCIRCHTTDYRAVDGYLDEKATPQTSTVTCEACHGRGAVHVSLSGQTEEARFKKVDPGKCVICHDEELSADFHYPTYWPKIRHGKGLSPEAGEAQPQEAPPQ